MLQSLKGGLPTDEASVGDWLTVLSIGYVAADALIALIVYTWLRRMAFSLTPCVSNALLFSTSILLLCGGLNRPTFTLLGSLTPYLLFAGLIGAGFALQELARLR